MRRQRREGVHLRSNKGFTLIELILVVVILGFIASMFLPRFVDLTSKSRESASKGSLGAVRSAIAITYASNAVYAAATMIPTTVEAAMFQSDIIPAETVSVASGNSAVYVSSEAPVNVTDTGGWWYDSVNGRVWINHSLYSDW